MWMLLGVLGLLVFLSGVVATIIFAIRKQWKMVRNVGLAAVAGFVLFMVGAINDDDTPTKETVTEPVQVVEQGIKEQLSKKEIDKSIYLTELKVNTDYITKEFDDIWEEHWRKMFIELEDGSIDTEHGLDNAVQVRNRYLALMQFIDELVIPEDFGYSEELEKLAIRIIV